MNASSHFGEDAASVAASAPHTLMVHDRRFGRDTRQGRWWLGGDPVATAWFNALSVTFPRGEALFIDSVQASCPAFIHGTATTGR